jgi:archaeosine synthase
MFEVTYRNGLARAGKWLMDDKELMVGTPNILFIEAEGIEPPEESEILISESKSKHDKPHIVSSSSLFMEGSEKIGQDTISPALYYPPSQTELNSNAAKMNKEKLASRLYLVTGKDEMVANCAFEVDAEVFVLANSLHLIRNPRSFISSIVNLRETIGYHRLIYTPGLGGPSHMALLAYSGVDLFDSTSLILNARLGNYLTSQGKIHKERAKESFCFCPSCVSGKGDHGSILGHNYYAAISELNMVKNAIRNGHLRELVESRIRSEPQMVSALRILDTGYYTSSEKYFPVSGGQMIAASNESLFRPEIVRFRKRVQNRYQKPPHPKALLLLPCSAKKPYSFSKTHKMFRRAITECKNPSAIHEVIITSPLGIVPRELELFYPAQQYDIPVTHDWGRDEMADIGVGLSDFLKANSYDEIVVHLPSDYLFIGDYIKSFTNTCKDRPTSPSSLSELTEVLSDLSSKYERVGKAVQMRESMRSFARFQFGGAGDALLENAQIKGRYPNLKILRDKKQLGMLVGKRGLISLTLEGAKIIARENTYRVKIDDFVPKGNIFAVGVLDVDPEIRIGDDVVVQRDDELVGVGVALMNPEEMKQSQKGEAVHIRHLVKSG